MIETWNKIAGDKKAFTKSNAKILTLDNYYSGEKAIRDLKIKPSRVDDAISDALEWFRKENYISDDNYSIHGTNFDLWKLMPFAVSRGPCFPKRTLYSSQFLAETGVQPISA